MTVQGPKLGSGENGKELVPCHGLIFGLASELQAVYDLVLTQSREVAKFGM